MKLSITMAAAGVAATTLVGCGTVAKNSDVGLVHTGLGPAVVIAENSAVQITDTGPPISSQTRRVSGYSCKNKLWDPAPSKENATNLMKAEASRLGFNAIHSVKVGSDPLSVAKNCWSGISATGIAYKASPQSSL